MSFVLVHDAIGANVPHLPPGQVAGYVTGLPPVPWSSAQQAAHPGMVRIAQSPNLSIDEGVDADVLDVENGAATNAEAAPWYRKALASYQTVAHPGQRLPMIYTSASNVTPLVNSLIAEGVRSGPRLWIAHWGEPTSEVLAQLIAANGPYPIEGIQFTDNANAGGLYDTSFFSSIYLTTQSHVATPPATGPFPHAFGGRSIGEAAAERHEPVADLLAHTAAAMTGTDEQEWGAIVPAATARFYTVNP